MSEWEDWASARIEELESALEALLSWKNWAHEYSTDDFDRQRSADYAKAAELLEPP